MARDKQIITYVDDPERRTIEAKATAADQSVSEFVREAIEEKIEREGLESTGQRYQFEERLLDLVAEASDQAADRITDQVLDELAARDQFASEDSDPDGDDDETRGGDIIDFS